MQIILMFSKSAAFWNSRNPKDFGISERLRFSEDLREASLLPRIKWLLAFLFLPALAFADLSEWTTDISLNDDRSADWTVVLRYNESITKSDYFLLSRI